MAAKKTKEQEPIKEKKTKTKKAAEAAKPAGSFHIMSNPEAFIAAVGASLKTVMERRKGREVNIRPQSEMLVETLPLRSLYFQWMINNRGLPKGVTNFVGKDRLGKTSLIWNLLGGFVLGGIPCVLLVCEKKGANPLWSARCMTNDRERAHAMVGSVMVDEIQLLAQMSEFVLECCKLLRDPTSEVYVPMHLPIAVVADPINKLATNAQAAGIVAYDGKDKEKRTELADHGHMWDRAKWLHAWVVEFLLEFSRYNIHLILSEHQNEDGPGGTGARAPSFLPQYTKELNHRTKNGGQAINQVTNLQLTFAEKGFIYSAGEKVARRIIISPYKNSYGPEGRSCCFALKGDDFHDTDNYLDSGLRWDYTEVEWLAENGYLGFRKTGATLAAERFSCAALGITQASLCEAAQAWREAPQEMRDALGAQLEIPGYVDMYSRVVKGLKLEDK